MSRASKLKCSSIFSFLAITYFVSWSIYFLVHDYNFLLNLFLFLVIPIILLGPINGTPKKSLKRLFERQLRPQEAPRWTEFTKKLN